MVDFLIAEMEDAITMGFKAKIAVLPFAHFISYILSRIDEDEDAPGPYHEVYMAASSFPYYRAQPPRAPVVLAQAAPKVEGVEGQGEQH